MPLKLRKIGSSGKDAQHSQGFGLGRKNLEIWRALKNKGVQSLGARMWKPG
jgi:hypothetical protein